MCSSTLHKLVFVPVWHCNHTPFMCSLLLLLLKLFLPLLAPQAAECSAAKAYVGCETAKCLKSPAMLHYTSIAHEGTAMDTWGPQGEHRKQVQGGTCALGCRGCSDMTRLSTLACTEQSARCELDCFYV